MKPVVDYSAFIPPPQTFGEFEANRPLWVNNTQQRTNMMEEVVEAKVQREKVGALSKRQAFWLFNPVASSPFVNRGVDVLASAVQPWSMLGLPYVTVPNIQYHSASDKTLAAAGTIAGIVIAAGAPEIARKSAGRVVTNIISPFQYRNKLKDIKDLYNTFGLKQMVKSVIKDDALWARYELLVENGIDEALNLTDNLIRANLMPGLLHSDEPYRALFKLKPHSFAKGNYNSYFRNNRLFLSPKVMGKGEGAMSLKDAARLKIRAYEDRIGINKYLKELELPSLPTPTNFVMGGYGTASEFTDDAVRIYFRDDWDFTLHKAEILDRKHARKRLSEIKSIKTFNDSRLEKYFDKDQLEFLNKDDITRSLGHEKDFFRRKLSVYRQRALVDKFIAPVSIEGQFTTNINKEAIKLSDEFKVSADAFLERYRNDVSGRINKVDFLQAQRDFKRKLNNLLVPEYNNILYESLEKTQELGLR